MWTLLGSIQGTCFLSPNLAHLPEISKWFLPDASLAWPFTSPGGRCLVTGNSGFGVITPSLAKRSCNREVPAVTHGFAFSVPPIPPAKLNMSFLEKCKDRQQATGGGRSPWAGRCQALPAVKFLPSLSVFLWSLGVAREEPRSFLQQASYRRDFTVGPSDHC